MTTSHVFLLENLCCKRLCANDKRHFHHYFLCAERFTLWEILDIDLLYIHLQVEKPHINQMSHIVLLLFFSESFEDNLIDWTSPVEEQHVSRPLIPLPIFTSPQNNIDGDNPFDTLERQVNDEVLDMLNMKSLCGTGQKSPVRIECQDSKPETFEILIRLSEVEVNEPTNGIDSLNVADASELQRLPSSPSSRTIGSIDSLKYINIHEMIADCASACVDQIPKNKILDSNLMVRIFIYIRA